MCMAARQQKHAFLILFFAALLPVEISRIICYSFTWGTLMLIKVMSHRVGKVLSFSPVVRIGTPPTPNMQVSVPPPPCVPGVGAHSLAREGLGESNSEKGTYHKVLIYIVLGLPGLCSSVPRLETGAPKLQNVSTGRVKITRESN
jgi:hypothetical protein